MSSKKSRLKVTVKVLDTDLEATNLTCSPDEVDINSITPIQFYHEKCMARRRKSLSENHADMFRLTCSTDLPISDDVSEDEINAEQFVSRKRIVLTDKDLNVIHGHDSVLVAREQDDKSIVVLRIDQKLSDQAVFLLQVRHAAKEGLLTPSVRMEVIRTLIDELNLSIEDVQYLLVDAKGKRKTPKEVESEYRVGKCFEENPGYRIPHTGFELDRHSFSNLKYLCGNNTIYDEMIKGKTQEEHFLNMAISTTKKRNKRLNDEIPPLMKHEDTKQALFTQGLVQAKALLKAAHPEEFRDQHPQYDVVAAIEKLKNVETLVLLKRQIESNPANNTFIKLVADFMESVAGLSPAGRKELLRSMCHMAPEEFAEAISESHPELVVQALAAKKQRINTLLKEIN